MKKAYVKPVFVADEFVIVPSIASCGVSPYGDPLAFDENTRLCSGTHNGQSQGHLAGKGNLNLTYASGMDYWKYATTDTTESLIDGTKPDEGNTETLFNNGNAYLFTEHSVVCDFVWPGNNGQDVVKVWNSAVVSERKTTMDVLIDDVKATFANLFFGNNANLDKHSPGYQGKAFMS